MSVKSNGFNSVKVLFQRPTYALYVTQSRRCSVEWVNYHMKLDSTNQPNFLGRCSLFESSDSVDVGEMWRMVHVVGNQEGISRVENNGYFSVDLLAGPGKIRKVLGRVYFDRTGIKVCRVAFVPRAWRCDWHRILVEQEKAVDHIS
jgi:hypothetical protein